MAISAKDLQITFALLLVVFGLNIFAGMAGIVDDDLDREPPTLNMSADRFDFAGEYPDRPGTPSSGTAEWGFIGKNSVPGQSQIWIDKPTADGTSLELQNVSSEFRLVIVNFESTAEGSQEDGRDEFTINQGDEGRTMLLDNQTSGWTIEFEVTELENYRESNMEAAVEFEILESPSDEGGGLTALPIIGGLFGAGEQLVSMLGWLGLVIRWAAVSFVQGVLNAFVVLLDIAGFLIGLLGYLFGGATAFASAPDQGWATFIAHLPLVALGLMFAKIGVGLVEASDWL